jgi:hypothetical protein
VSGLFVKENSRKKESWRDNFKGYNLIFLEKFEGKVLLNFELARSIQNFCGIQRFLEENSFKIE